MNKKDKILKFKINCIITYHELYMHKSKKINISISFWMLLGCG